MSEDNIVCVGVVKGKDQEMTALRAQLSEAQEEILKLHTSIEEYEIENDKWRNYYNNLKQEIAALRATIAERESELAELRRWKESQLQVESSWDIQLVAKEMSLPLGVGIRSYILPYIQKLKKENAELRERLKLVEYQKYEFCKDVECTALEYNACNAYVCYKTAKHFHRWLKQNGYAIVKAIKATCEKKEKMDEI